MSENSRNAFGQTSGDLAKAENGRHFLKWIFLDSWYNYTLNHEYSLFLDRWV